MRQNDITIQTNHGINDSTIVHRIDSTTEAYKALSIRCACHKRQTCPTSPHRSLMNGVFSHFCGESRHATDTERGQMVVCCGAKIMSLCDFHVACVRFVRRELCCPNERKMRAQNPQKVSRLNADRERSAGWPIAFCIQESSAIKPKYIDKWTQIGARRF